MTTQSEMTILLNLRDKATAGFKKAGGGIDKYKAQLRLGAAAAVGAGLAIEGLAKKVAPLNEAVGKLAAQTDLTDKEIRGMATSLSNATFPLDEVITLMGLASKAGLKSKKAMTEYAQFWDMIGDATGLSSEALAKSGAALKAVGIEAGQEADILQALGLITTQTSGNVGDFLRSIEKLAPEMGRANITVDDAAVLMTALERELGLTAKTARTEFKEALDLNGESLETVIAALGLTEEQTAKYRAELETSGDVIKEQAEAYAATKTSLDKLKSSFGDTIFQMGPFIQQASAIAPILLVIGPAMAAVTVAQKAWTIATNAGTVALKLMGIATKLALGPFGLILIAITGLIAVGILIMKNWDEISAKVMEVWGFIADFFNETWDRIVGIFRDNWKLILGILFPAFGIAQLIMQNWGAIVDTVKGIFGNVVQAVKDAINLVIGLINGFINRVNSIRIRIPGFSSGIPGVPSFPGIDIGVPQIPNIPRLAKGGIFDKPTLAVIGESGREAVVPLGKGGSGGIGATIIGPIVSVQNLLGGDLADIMEIGLAELERRGVVIRVA